jgi:HD-like signal output (HDOD) protein
MDAISEVVRFHHEYFNGAGFPGELRGDQIPIASRIISVANAYDLMTSPRSTDQICDHDIALLHLESQIGSTFDPSVVQALYTLERIDRIRRAIGDGECEGFIGVSLTAAEIMSASMNQLMAVAESEPFMALSLVRAANEFHNDRAATASLYEACERLGEDRVKTILLKHSDRKWSHPKTGRIHERSLRRAIAARDIAGLASLLDPIEAYTIGLVQDVGEILLLSLYPDDMREAMAVENEARSEREIEFFGVDHAQAGQWILDYYGMPARLGIAVQCSRDGMKTVAPLAILLQVADAIANADEAYKAASLDSISRERLSLLGLGRADLAAIHARTTDEIENRQLVALC